MKIERENWIFCVGKAGYGKSYFIRKHLEKLPALKAYILDFNANDYQEFSQSQNIWNVKEGSQEEIEKFMRLVYTKGNCFTVFEEADNYFFYETVMIRRFVLTARNRGIGAIVSAKRAKAIKPIYRNRFTHLILFHCDIEEDIRYLEAWCGHGKKSLDCLKTLSVGEYISVDLENHSMEKHEPI